VSWIVWKGLAVPTVGAQSGRGQVGDHPGVDKEAGGRKIQRNNNACEPTRERKFVIPAPTKNRRKGARTEIEDHLGKIVRRGDKPEEAGVWDEI